MIDDSADRGYAAIDPDAMRIWLSIVCRRRFHGGRDGRQMVVELARSDHVKERAFGLEKCQLAHPAG